MASSINRAAFCTSAAIVMLKIPCSPFTPTATANDSTCVRETAILQNVKRARARAREQGIERESEIARERENER